MGALNLERPGLEQRFDLGLQFRDASAGVPDVLRMRQPDRGADQDNEGLQMCNGGQLFHA